MNCAQRFPFLQDYIHSLNWKYKVSLKDAGKQSRNIMKKRGEKRAQNERKLHDV